MSYFDPQKIIERFQAGEWSDLPLYCAAYKAIRQKQNAVIRLAEDLRRLQARDLPRDPLQETQGALFEKETLKALHDNNTAYLRSLLRATQLLKKGRPEWRFTLPALIILAILDLRENYHRQRINKSELRRRVSDWQRTHGQDSAHNDSQWHRALKRPEVVALLG